jgi:hypothetical protein
MIDDVVNKAKVLTTTSHLLEQTPRRRKITDPLVGLGSLFFRRAARAEQKTMAADPSQSDRKSYIPRDMLLSLFQAEHEEHLDRVLPGRVTTASERQPMASRPVVPVEPFSEGHGIDPGFVVGFLKLLPKHLVQRVLFRLPPGQPREHPLAEDARIVVVGDWGTGEGLALEVADRMREAITDAGDREVHVVHLGDVYYAGTHWEAHRRFLADWPVAKAARHGSWCLNGNHDMYSAGKGLIQVILADPRFAAQRTTRGAVTSEFLLLDRTRGLGRARRITGWFWGHEHKLIAYGAHVDIGYATCMGHGAILEAPAQKPHSGELNGRFTDPEGLTWRMPGFTVLDLDGPTMRVRYLDKTGRPWRADDVLPAPS